MRVLLSSTRGAGHFLPLVSFGRAAQRRGAEVIAAGPPSLEGMVQEAGFAFWPFDAPPEDALERVWSCVAALAPEEQNAFVVREIFGRLNTTASLPRLREACEELRPDLVLREPSEFGAAVAAELTAIPHAQVAISLMTVDAEALGQAAATIDAVRRDAGLPSDPDARRLRDAPYLTLFPASLDPPAAGSQRPTIRARDPDWEMPTKSWAASWDDASAPLVYITFGSVAGGMPQAAGVYAQAIRAVSALPVRALLTVGQEMDPGALGDHPSNVRVERWVPQADVLAEASVTVCHGGAGSILGALAAGVPLVVVPLFADQPINAERVAAAGAAVVVEPPDADSLRSAIQQVRDDPRPAEAARRARDELLATPTTDQALERLSEATARDH